MTVLNVNLGKSQSLLLQGKSENLPLICGSS
jgi:hypothetical protein